MLDSEKVAEMRKEYLMPCLNHFYKEPPVFVKGEMQYLYDDKGKKYLDFFSGVSVMNCGHSNPYILERIIKQLNTLQHVTNIYLTQPIVELAEKLAEVLPANLQNSFFCMSGSEANEGALLLARVYTGKKKFVALKNSLHGRTFLTMALTDISMWRADPFLPEDFYFIENSLNEEQSLKQLEKILEKDNNIAGFIAEPIQGNGGIITASEDYFEKISSILKKHNVLMVIDEVQTGFARTGKMFAIEHYRVAPDILTMSKAFGNGIPIAAFSTTKEIAAKFTTPSASTLGGNPVSCAAALAVIDYIKEYNLCERAETLGDILKKELLKMQDKYRFIKEVRGKGLMLGLEICGDWTDSILEKMKEHGIIIGKNGISRNVLAFQPPIVINENDINFLLENLNIIFTEINSYLDTTNKK